MASGVLVEFQGGRTFFLMNFELLTFLCLQINDQTYHTYTTSFQNESIYIQKTHVLCDACIVCIDIAKLHTVFDVITEHALISGHPPFS